MYKKKLERYQTNYENSDNELRRLIKQNKKLQGSIDILFKEKRENREMVKMLTEYQRWYEYINPPFWSFS